MADVRCEIEEGVLAWAICDSEHVPMVAEEDHDLFTKPHTRTIHQAIQMLYGEGEPVTYRTIKGKLASNGQTVEMGGILADAKGRVGECRTLLGQLKDLDFQSRRRDLGNYLIRTTDPFQVVEKEVDRVLHMKGTRTAVDIGDEADLCDYYAGVRAQQTGIDILDEDGGIYDGEMVVLAARPGVGKTTIAINVADHFLEKESPVYFVTREMTRREIVTRMLTKRTGVDYHKIMRRRGTPKEMELVSKEWDDIRQRWKGLLYIDDKMSSIDDLALAIRGCGCTRKMGLVIVDYIGLMQGQGRSDYERVSYISRSIKAFANRFYVPVLALSQLSREVEKRKSPEPQLSDLRDSGAIEQDANVVLFAWEEEYGQAWFTKAKARNGRPGKQKYWIRKDMYRISNGRDIVVAP